jgi:hypothetical protein
MRTLTGFTLFDTAGPGWTGVSTGADLAAELRSTENSGREVFRGSVFPLARELYLKAVTLDATPAEKRWASFRLADTLWRAQAASQSSDSTPFDQAREELERLVRETQTSELRDPRLGGGAAVLGRFLVDAPQQCQLQPGLAALSTSTRMVGGFF